MANESQPGLSGVSATVKQSKYDCLAATHFDKVVGSVTQTVREVGESTTRTLKVAMSSKVAQYIPDDGDELLDLFDRLARVFNNRHERRDPTPQIDMLEDAERIIDDEIRPDGERVSSVTFQKAIDGVPQGDPVTLTAKQNKEITDKLRQGLRADESVGVA